MQVQPEGHPFAVEQHTLDMAHTLVALTGGGRYVIRRTGITFPRAARRGTVDIEVDAPECGKCPLRLVNRKDGAVVALDRIATVLLPDVITYLRGTA